MPLEASYELNEHRHRFAVWAASRAAQRGFSGVSPLRAALESCRVVEYLTGANLNDIDVDRFDDAHRKWCHGIVGFLSKAGLDAAYGRAAKLLAIYLKTVVILGPHTGTVFAQVAHPPIDSILLKKLAKCQAASEHARRWATTKWTKLNEDEYFELIRQLRQVVGLTQPFWKLERYWTVTDDADLE